MNTPRIIVIAGASGYIGHHLTQAWEARGATVRTIGRGARNTATWGDEPALRETLRGADLLVNLAGRSVDCRYDKRNADAIFSSRTETTAELGRVLATVDDGPALWINASTGTIYRDARDRPMSEADGDLGHGFSVAVARAWERELFEAPVAVRKVALRLAIVVGAGGGAVNPLITLSRLGFGGRQGDGEQLFSWIHLDDVIRAIDHVIDDATIEGPVNVAAPEPVPNRVMMRAVRRATRRRWGLPAPVWLLELGARIIRTEPELILKSRWVAPRVLLDSGFTFAHPDLDEALADVVAKSGRGLLPVSHGGSATRPGKGRPQ